MGQVLIYAFIAGVSFATMATLFSNNQWIGIGIGALIVLSIYSLVGIYLQVEKITNKLDDIISELQQLKK
jgi:hypothetical protein